MRLLNVSLSRLATNQLLRYWHWYGGATLALFATHWIQSHLPFWAKELAEMVGDEARHVPYTRFLWPALGILVFRSLSRILFFYPARLAEKDIRLGLLTMLQDVPPARYGRHSEGQIFQVLGMDVDQVRALLGFAFLQVANIVIALVVLIPKMWSFDPNLLVGMIPMLPALGIFTVVVGRNHKLYRRMQNLQGEAQNFIMESYTGKKTIKNFHAEKSFIGLFKEHSLKELKTFYTASSRVAFSMPLIPLGVGLSLIWGAHLVFSAGHGVSALILFSGFVFLFLEPLHYVSWMGVVVARTIGCWDRIQEFLGDLARVAPGENIEGDLESGFGLEFWGRTLDLSFGRGRWNALVGATGHGKSHLLVQIAGALKARGTRVAYVAQTPYLYNDTIEGNIFLGRPRNPKELHRACVLLDLFDLRYLARNAEEALDIEVGEHGKRLSGGQVKRLALIRSLMSGAQVILWDDPFSSVDVILEKQIMARIVQAPELVGKTVILTSHRLTTVRRCDHIAFVEKGRGLVEQGSPWRLLNGESKTGDYFAKQVI